MEQVNQSDYTRYQRDYTRNQRDYTLYQTDYTCTKGITHGTKGITHGTKAITHGTKGITHGSQNRLRSHTIGQSLMFIYIHIVFTSSCLWEVPCLIYVICVCSVRLYLQLFVGGLMSYLRYLCLFGLSLPPVVCGRFHVLFTLFVFTCTKCDIPVYVFICI